MNTRKPKIFSLFSRRPASFLCGFLCLVTLGLGCRDTSGLSESADGVDGQAKIHATATVGMVGDLVRNVGGEQVSVATLMGSGVDPHLYKATRDDVRIIMETDIVFFSGLMLEGKMIDALKQVSKIRPVYAITAELDRDLLLEPEDFSDHFDPHVWMDVAAWSEGVEVIRSALSSLDPQNHDLYQERAQVYRSKLQQLDDLARTSIATIPSSQRVLITSHDAFNYFGRAYGLEVIGVQGLSTESEAGLQQINKLVDLLVDRGITAVFVETSVPRKSIEALVDGAGARGHEVKIGGTLYSDAMGANGTFEGTYIGMITHNVLTVVRALGGTVDDKAWASLMGDDVVHDSAAGTLH